jgi:hypothetical protein
VKKRSKIKSIIRSKRMELKPENFFLDYYYTSYEPLYTKFYWGVENPTVNIIMDQIDET